MKSLKAYFSIISLIGLFSSSVYAVDFKKGETKKLQSCMEEQTKLCKNAQNPESCFVTAMKNAKPSCKRLFKKMSATFVQSGGECADVLKMCPIKSSPSEADITKMQKCIQKKMAKLPKRCQRWMSHRYEKVTGKKKDYKQIVKDAEKSGGKGKNVQVKTR